MALNPSADEFLKHYSPVDVEETVWRAGEIELNYLLVHHVR